MTPSLEVFNGPYTTWSTSGLLLLSRKMRHCKCILDKGFLPESWKVHLNQSVQHYNALGPAHLAGQGPSPGSHLCPWDNIHPGQGLGVVVERMGHCGSHILSKACWNQRKCVPLAQQALESASSTQQDVSKYLTNQRMNDRRESLLLSKSQLCTDRTPWTSCLGPATSGCSLPHPGCWKH